jgi:pimeloyl-ACP methyl ester carboxylesterase
MGTEVMTGRQELRNGSNQMCAVSSGRKLGYAEYGDHSGKPLMFFHGGGASRLLGELLDVPARAAGLRVIAPDRPGIGLSENQPGRSLLDWPEDVRELADHLLVEQFGVLGFSAGGPYALACARAIPERLTAAIVVSSMAPPEAPTHGQSGVTRALLGLSRRFPAVYGGIFATIVRRAQQHPDRFVEQFFVGWPTPDRTVVSRPDVGRIITQATIEGYRAGGRSVGWDVALCTRKWPFRLQDITPPVRLWHGEADTIVPTAAARYVAATISQCQSTYCPGEGHISTLVNHLDEMMTYAAAT